MLIAKDTVVSMHYRVATAEGEHVDSSDGGEPLVYLHGYGNIIAGLEAALVGKAQGAVVDAEIPAAQAYGERDTALDLVVPKNSFPADIHANLKPDFRFRAEHPSKEGEEILFTIHQVEGDDVFVSGNHALAGKDLLFHVEIVDVRAASGEEVAHGHVHGAGGHHH